MGVVLVRDTRPNDSRSNDHDSCINYANMLTLYRDKTRYEGSKTICAICKLPGFLSEENKFDQISCNFTVFPFQTFWWKWYCKISGWIGRNCSNRLYQSALPEFNTFSIFLCCLYFRKFAVSLITHKKKQACKILSYFFQ